MNIQIGKENGRGWNGIAGLLLSTMLTLVIILGSQTVCLATSVTLQWDANTDSDLAGYKVYYQADSSSTPFEANTPVDVKSTTTATVSGLDSNHAYYFAVTAYNSSGEESDYSDVVSVPELVSPTTSITYPAVSATVNGTVSVAASASDNVGVSRVEFYVNNVLQTTDTASPYVFSWNTSGLSAGSYTLMTKAYDAAGNVGQSGSVVVTVANDTTAPTTSISSPANGSTLSGTATITAGASDNVGVSKVEIYANGTLLFAGNSSPYSYSWNTKSVANGSYALIAKAYDAAGNVGQSGSVSVTVFNDTTVPTVSITAPSAGSTVSGTVAVTASASDNVGVSKVEIYRSGTLLSTVSASPYSYSWNTKSVTNGSYPLMAKAYDAAGNVGQSANVTVTVNNDTTVPTVTAFTLPATATSLTVPVSSLTATDNVAVAGYMITTSSTAPAATASGWSATVPTSFTFTATGAQTAYAWAKDAAGNVSAGVSAKTTISVSGFTTDTIIGETSVLSGKDSGNGNLLLVQSASLAKTATIQSMSFYVTTAAGKLRMGIYDATGTGGGPGKLLATTAEITPAAGWNKANVTTAVSLNSGTYWLAFLPSSGSLSCSNTYASGTVKWAGYTYGTMPATFPATQGSMTAHWSFYATLNSAPTVTSFTLPATATSLTVPVSSLTATDDVAVTGYMITTSSTAPAATATGWSTTAPTSFTFTATGAQTAYAWAKDAAGNVSAGVSASTTISIPSTIGETNILSGNDSGNGNLLLVQSASLTKTATIQSMSFYVTSATGKLRMGIYDATGTGGGPGKLLATTAEITPAAGWNKANVTTAVSLNAGTYWLAFLPSSGSMGCSNTYASGTAKWANYTYGTMPAAFPAIQGSMTAHWSFYATLN